MIHIMRYLCPARHRYAAIAWDARHRSVAAAREQLGEIVVETAKRHRTQVPVCPFCGSTAFAAEDSRTRYRSTLDAGSALVLEGIAQQQAMIMDPRRN